MEAFVTDQWLLQEQEWEALAVTWSGLSRKEQRSVAVVQYMCVIRDCQLVTVFRAPVGLLVALPRYRKSPERNAESAASARAARTVDGERRWKGRVAPLDQFSDAQLPELGIEVNCDHVSRFISGVHLLADVERGRPGAPITKRIR
ncbi:hypothetical protein D0Z06_04120 [Geodermatophilus marinus]|nr:hypothetical protein D0Z06_04120 [Geodermatophilus sp. LHW52908]